jgi:two-component system chemotaxis sensor kinase CheA
MLDASSELYITYFPELLKKPENELTDREIYSYIFLPGFSTNEEVTEFSGRGVGMDVVNKNIEEIGGTVQVDSAYEIGTTVSIKIPLTLAIIDGMKVRVGKSIYIIPITSIKESFKVQESAIIRDEANNSEIIMLRGNCYPVIRLHEFFSVKPDTTNLNEGIIVVVENEAKLTCLFVDELMGVQQVVVKVLPRYIKKVNGISGCTVMGNGSVSLIIDVSGLVNSS